MKFFNLILIALFCFSLVLTLDSIEATTKTTTTIVTTSVNVAPTSFSLLENDIKCEEEYLINNDKEYTATIVEDPYKCIGKKVYQKPDENGDFTIDLIFCGRMLKNYKKDDAVKMNEYYVVLKSIYYRIKKEEEEIF
eukprot:jgi/Orpsp1_1/1174270/evm.model.c7180000049476.1